MIKTIALDYAVARLKQHAPRARVVKIIIAYYIIIRTVGAVKYYIQPRNHGLKRLVQRNPQHTVRLKPLKLFDIGRHIQVSKINGPEFKQIARVKRITPALHVSYDYNVAFFYFKAKHEIIMYINAIVAVMPEVAVLDYYIAV
jgi:hypothetical protein